MILYKNGDLFDTTADAIVNTVNCVGVMGRGIALQFKKRFPDNFDFYAKACKKHEVQPGKMLVFETGNVINPKYVINFPTKRHWRGASRIEDIESGLKDLVQVISTKNIRSIAIPPLGCGLGGLDWRIVKEKIESALGDLPNVSIEVYEPGHAPTAEAMVSNRQKPVMTPGRAALILLIHKYLGILLDPFITLLEIHKLMYFLQERGEKLSLKYEKAVYGPYATNLRHVLNAIEGYYISGYADGGDQPGKAIELRPKARSEAESYLRDHPETSERMEQVCALVKGFESSFGLELLATVHWLVVHEDCHDLNTIVQSTYQWNSHKRQFSPRQIELATSRLMHSGWIPQIDGVQ